MSDRIKGSALSMGSSVMGIKTILISDEDFADLNRAKYTEHKTLVLCDECISLSSAEGLFCLTKSDYFSDLRLYLWAYPPF